MRRAVIAALALAGCGGSQVIDVVPTLPGTGDANTDRPVAPRPEEPDQAAGPWADASKLIPIPEPQPARPLSLPEIEEVELPNGLTVVMVPDATAPVVSFQVAVRAGRQLAPRDKVGLARLSAIMLAKGTRSRSAAALADQIETAGGTISADASYEATLVSCNILSLKTRICIDLLADMITAPTFPASELEKAKAELKANVAQRIESGSQLSADHFQNQLWGDHPRGWPLSVRTVSAITRNDVVAWHRKYFVPGNTILAVAGNFEPKALRAKLSARFGRWAKRSAPKATAPETPALSGIKIRLVDKPDQKRADLRVGRIGIGHLDPAFFPAVVANHIFGGATGSRLDLALEADVLSQIDRNLATGSVVVSAATTPDAVVATIRTIRAQMASFAKGGPTEDELVRAGQQLAGGYAVRFQSATDIAGAILAARLHGLGADYVKGYPVSVRSVTAARVQQAAARLFGGDDLAVVIVGPAKVIGRQLKSAGWSFETVRFVDPIAPWEREGLEKVARKILDDALAAKGGASKLSKLKSFYWSGTAALRQAQGNMSAAVTKRYKAPSRLRLDMDIKAAGVKLVTVMAGNTGWAQQVTKEGKRAIDFPKAEVEAGKAQIWRDQDLVLLRHREPRASVVLVDETKVDGKPTSAVRVTSPDNKYSVVLLIDKASKLLVGMSYQERAPNGQMLRTEERYSDYRKVGGIQIAHKRTTRSAQIDLTTTLSKVELNKPIDDKLFIKPR